MKSAVPTSSPVPVTVSPPRGRAADPEVGQVDAPGVGAAADEHVRRLDVAVDEPGGVRGVEAGGDGADHLGRRAGVERAVDGDQLWRRSLPSTRRIAR